MTPPEPTQLQPANISELDPALARVLERVTAEDNGEEESLWSDFSSHNQK